jgi:MFS family permease
VSVTDSDDHVATTPEPGYESLWHNRDFVKFWIGETISLFGTQVTNLALPLTAIYVFNASNQLVGVLRFLQLAPYIVFALLFGVWADRVSRRKVMLWTNLVRVVLVGAVPVLHWANVLDMPTLLCIACTVGVASVLFDVSWMPFVPALVKDTEHYVEASAKMGVSSSMSDVAGPGIAGVLVGALTAPIALLVDSCSYLVSVVSLLLIRTPEAPRAASVERHVATELREGLVWVFRNPILRWLAVVGFGCNFSMITVWTMFLLYGTQGLHLSSATLGAIFATASVGGLIGAMISRKVIGRFPLGPTYFVSMSGLLLGPVIIASAGGPKPVVIGLVVLSFFTTYLGLGVANVVVISLRQTTTPQSMMGRMTACFRMLLFGGGALGGLNAGLLSGAIGDRQALTVAAIASGAVVIALVRSPVSRLRELPPAAQEPAPADGPA